MLRGDQPAAGALAPDRPRAGPNLLALVLAAKYGQHLPLTRPRAIDAREGVEIDVSTLADWVGAAAASLMPLVGAIRAQVFAAERRHGDDTTVPVLAKERTRIGRLWVYVRDDRPFAGPAPPAAAFFYSPDREGLHPERHLARFTGILQADAYGGFNRLYEPGRQLTDGRLCLRNNAAERARRGVALGRRNWTFAGSDRGGERAAAACTLVEGAKLHGIDPQAWLADVLARLPDHPAKRITDLLPWNWCAAHPDDHAAKADAIVG